MLRLVPVWYQLLRVWRVRLADCQKGFHPALLGGLIAATHRRWAGTRRRGSATRRRGHERLATLSRAGVRRVMQTRLTWFEPHYHAGSSAMKQRLATESGLSSETSRRKTMDGDSRKHPTKSTNNSVTAEQPCWVCHFLPAKGIVVLLRGRVGRRTAAALRPEADKRERWKRCWRNNFDRRQDWWRRKRPRRRGWRRGVLQRAALRWRHRRGPGTCRRA